MTTTEPPLTATDPTSAAATGAGSDATVERGHPAGPRTRRGLPPLPLKRLFLLALLASVLTATAVMIDVNRFGGNPLSLIQPGGDGPSAAVVAKDFPKTEFPPGLGFDGQMFYAAARQPMHLAKVAPDLDRPQYRLQRPLLPVLAWALHPQGGGLGLVMALFFVGFATLIVGGMSMGAISATLGGKTWPAFLFPLLPGSYVCLRTSVADALGVALALLAIALALRSRWGLAVMAAVAAVLGKEVAVILLIGMALWRRDRRWALLAAAPIVAAAAWWVALHLILPDGGGRVNEIVVPFTGLARSVRRWADHRELSGMAAVVTTVVLAGVALVRRGLRHPFAPAIVLHLAFTTVLGVDVIANNLSGTRSTLALLSCTILAFAIPSRPPVDAGEGRDATVATVTA